MKFILEWQKYEKRTRTEQITLEKAATLFLNECDDWALGGNQIYRGAESYPIFFVDPSKYHRYSANAAGFYQALLPNLESWKKAPKRHNSLIMSTDEFMADSFGEVYHMIPFNDTKIGQCPYSDIWNSNDVMRKMFDQPWIGWDEIDEEFTELICENFDIKKGDINQDNVMNYIRELDRMGKENWKTKYVLNFKSGAKEYDMDLILKLIEKYPDRTLEDLLNEMFDFDKNNFEIITRQMELKYDREVWSDGKFIGIHHEEWNRFLRKVDQMRNL